MWIAPQGCLYYPVYEAVQNAQPTRVARALSARRAKLVAALRLGSPTQPGTVREARDRP